MEHDPRYDPESTFLFRLALYVIVLAAAVVLWYF